MARNIRLDQIDDYLEEKLSKLVRRGTLETERRVKQLTPVDTGRLRVSWQRTIEPLKGEVFNNLQYAEPVIAGRNLPPSWGGQYRTRQDAQPFLDLVEKDMTTWFQGEASRIAGEQ